MEVVTRAVAAREIVTRRAKEGSTEVLEEV